MIDKRKLQIALDEVVATKTFNEEYGRQVLEIIDLAVFQKGLRRRFGEFEVDYIFKEQLLFDLLGNKALKYDKARMKANSYMTNIVNSSISDGLRKVMAFKYGNESVAFNSEVTEITTNLIAHTDTVALSDLVIEIKGRKKKIITIISN